MLVDRLRTHHISAVITCTNIRNPFAVFHHQSKTSAQSQSEAENATITSRLLYIRDDVSGYDVYLMTCAASI